MTEPARFRDSITLTKAEALDLVSECDDIAAKAEALREYEIAMLADRVRALLLGRLIR